MAHARRLARGDRQFGFAEERGHLQVTECLTQPGWRPQPAEIVPEQLDGVPAGLANLGRDCSQVGCRAPVDGAVGKAQRRLRCRHEVLSVDTYPV
jgi:hypothetical protein